MIGGRFDPGGRLELGAGAPERPVCRLEGRVTNLEQLGRTGPPEQVLADAWQHLGEELLRRLEGSFSLLVWDPARRSGLLARDRLGQQGLFTCQHDGALLFAAEIRELLRMLPRRPEPDPVAVAHYVSNTGLPGRRTLYAGVESVAPGELVRLSPDGWERRRWWWPEPASGGGQSEAPEEALLERMDAAVARARSGAGRAAVLLSGGFDSGAVAVLAARQAREAGQAPPRCYSSLFPAHPDVDEAERIAATRAAAGLEGFEQRYAGGRSAIGAAAEFLLEWELPPVSPNAFIWRPLIRRAAADGVEAVVDGEGGDELFGCSPYLIADALRRGRVLRARSLARAIPGMGDDPRRRWISRALRRYGLRGVLPAGLHGALRRARGSPGRASPLLRGPLADLHRESHDIWAWKRAPGPRWRAWLAHLTVLGPESLGANDYFRREASLCGVSFRHPFRDARLLEEVLSFDPALMFDPHLDRPLARRALAGRLPDAVRLDDSKPHFNALLEQALSGVDRDTLRGLLGDDARCREFLALPEGFCELDTSAGPRAGIELFRVAALECWLRLDGDRPALDRLRQLGVQEIAG